MCRFTKQSLMVFLIAGYIAPQVTAAAPSKTHQNATREALST